MAWSAVGFDALRRMRECLALLSWFMATGVPMAWAGYDPLARAEDVAIGHSDFSIVDRARGREIPVRVYLPATTNAVPVVLFSHGLGGNREGSAFLGEHWARRQYVAVFLQHPGSDDSTWKGRAPSDRLTALREAASAKNLLLRVRDVTAVLDQLDAWNGPGGHALSGRLDLKRVGMSGHSFGAVTTQAVSGQTFFGRGPFTDPRIRAAIAFSPSSPRVGDTASAFGSVKIPWMLMTGTRDVAIIGDADVPSRLAVFDALPPGDKYELVLYDGEHSAFTDRALPGDRMQRNPNHHRAILALSTAFWDAHLRGKEDALAWLRGQGPRSVLEEKDRWQIK